MDTVTVLCTMSETRNLEDMAKVLSEPIFTTFGWQRVGPENPNWDCVERDKHNKNKVKTHPSDVVFRYPEPYLGFDVYLTTDLKSYGANSINKSSLTPYLKSLAQSVECANKSGDWAKLYATDSKNWEVNGLLFVYNHDGNYDRDFDAVLSEIQFSDVPLALSQKVFVLGPSQIEFLDSVATDISIERGQKRLPDEKFCGFYYPDLEESKAQAKKVLPAATIEMLLGPWIVLRYQTFETGSMKAGYYFYYRGAGSSVDEFEYVLDYIFNYQLLEDYDHISIRMPFGDPKAPAIFQRAKRRYHDEYWPLAQSATENAEGRLSRIDCQLIAKFKERFSSIQLGMK